MDDRDDTTPRILLTGSFGQLGWELHRSCSPLGRVVATVGPEDPKGRRLDLTDPGAIRRIMREVEPDIVINAAAHTAVDRAEAEPELANAINGTAPALFAEEAGRRGALFVHFSTDYVFDGELDRPYRVDDTPAPANQYGRSKLRGEEAIRSVDGPHLILRSSWLYGARGNNFLRGILGRGKRSGPLKVVNDQIGAPTWARDVAESTAQIIAQTRVKTPDWLKEKSGTYHITASGACSWFDFARAILAAGDGEVRQVLPISSDEYPAAAVRPHNSLLDCSLLKETFGIQLGPWSDQLALVMEEVKENARA